MKKHAILAAILFVSLTLCLLSAYVKAQGEATIWTDKADYSPEETVTICGTGFLPESLLTVEVTRPDLTVDSWNANSGSDGSFTTTYLLDGITGTYRVVATDGTNTATTTFKDAELISTEVVASTPNAIIVVQQGETVNFKIQLTATGAIGGSFTPSNPNKAAINTAYSVVGTTGSSSTPSGYYDFYASSTPVGGSPGNYIVTWVGAPTPYEVSATAHADSGATPSDYTIRIPATFNNPSGSGGKMGDGTADYLTIRVVAAPSNVGPTAEANGPYSGNEGSSIAFSSSGSSDSDGEIVSYLWDFGDGYSSTDANPSHIYVNDGTYTATLTVTDDDGATGSDTASAIIADLAPTAAFSWMPSTPNEGALVTFKDESTSYDNIVSWNWNFGDGASSTNQNPTHTYADNGIYTVKLTVTDSDGSIVDVSQDVTVLNVAPTVTAPSDTSGDEGSPISIGSFTFTDPGILDTHTATIDWGDGATENLGTKTSPISGLSHTYADNDLYTVTVTVIDKDGDSGSASMKVTVNNVAPEITSLTLDDDTINENEVATLNCEFNDPGTLDTFIVTIDWGDGSVAEVFSYGAGTTSFSKTHQYLDDNPSGTASDDYTVTVTVTDDDSGSDTGFVTVTVSNVPPTITSLTGPMDPVKVNTEASISAIFTDPGTLDTHTATVYWGDGSSTDIVSATSPIALTHSYTSANIYTVTLTVTDDDTGSDTELYQYVVVYNPEGGFVTGGGWIWSPKGAYAADPLLEGKATFGFVSKYEKGATVPTGNTEFQLHVGNMNFKSTSYDWLVVSGAKAQIKGTGTINGSGEYKFLLTAIDGGKTGVDQFRIKIWYTDEYGVDHVVYDNKMGKADYGSDATAISGGSIVVHK